MKGDTATTRSGTRQVTFRSTVPSTHQYTIQNSIPNPNRAGNGPKNGIAKVISRITGPASTRSKRPAFVVSVKAVSFAPRCCPFATVVIVFSYRFHYCTLHRLPDHNLLSS